MIRKNKLRKNPKNFNSVILERIENSIKEARKELKQESWTNYNESFIEILKIMKSYFSENEDYMNNELISRLRWISEKLKEDVYEYTKFD